MNYEYLEERYQKIDVLGSSGKNNTYLAKDTVTGQIVVLKYISKENLLVYQCLMTVRHKNLVHIFFVVEGEKDALVIMEFVSGKTLKDCYGELGRLSEEEVLDIVKQLLEGLCIVHKLNIVHRDISPQNILVSSDGVLKIIDFDISRIVKEQQGCDTKLLGTAGYAAPEQFGFSQSDARTDIYGVGVILNVMLTGALPHEYCFKDGKLGEIIQKCTRMEPELRYQSAEELLKELQSIRVSGRKDVPFKNRPKTIRDILPGFRTGKIWKEIVAGYYYFAVIFASVIDVTDVAGKSKSLWWTMLELLAVVLYMWIAALGACNFLQWMEKVPFVRRENKITKGIIGILFWICFVCMGTLLEGYVKGNMPNIK